MLTHNQVCTAETTCTVLVVRWDLPSQKETNRKDRTGQAGQGRAMLLEHFMICQDPEECHVLGAVRSSLALLLLTAPKHMTPSVPWNKLTSGRTSGLLA